MVLWELYEVCAVIPVKITLQGNQSNKIPYIGDFEDCPFLWEPEVTVIDFLPINMGEGIEINVSYIPVKYLDDSRF